jgi:glutamate synthase (ferredoxin)
LDRNCKKKKLKCHVFGSISQEAHENLAIAMNRIGGKVILEKVEKILNVSKKRIKWRFRNSAIKQVASGSFGVSINYLTSAKEIKLKWHKVLNREGGQLPGEK